MIALLVLVFAAKMYARGSKVSDAQARSVLLARAESLDTMGNKVLLLVGKLIGLLWCLYGLLIVVSACGYPQVLEAMTPWLNTTALVLLIA